MLLFKSVANGVYLTLPWDPGAHIYVENAQLYTLAHELLGIVRHIGRDIWFSNNGIYVHPYAVISFELSRIFVCISVSTCLGDSGLLEIAFDTTILQLGISAVTCFPDHGLLERGIAARDQTGTWFHDFLIRLALLFLQVPWDPGGRHIGGLRANRISRGHECNTCTYCQSGLYAIGSWAVWLGQTVGTYGTKGKDWQGRIGTETDIEQKQRNGTPRLSSSSSGLNPPLL